MILLTTKPFYSYGIKTTIKLHNVSKEYETTRDAMYLNQLINIIEDKEFL